MSKKTIYRETAFDLFLKKLPDFWTFLRENITIISILITIVGSLNQILNLFLMSPSLVNYYSPTQGVLDGVLFLTYFLVIIITYYNFLILYYRVARSRNKVFKNYIAFVGILNMFVVGLILLNSQFYAIIPLILIPSFLFPTLISERNSEKIVEVQNTAHEKKIIERLIRKFYFYSIIFLTLVIFFSFWEVGRNVRKTSINNVINYELILTNLNFGDKYDYSVAYTNSLYVFFKDRKTGKFLVLRNEEILNKTIIER